MCLEGYKVLPAYLVSSGNVGVISSGQEPLLLLLSLGVEKSHLVRFRPGMLGRLVFELIPPHLDPGGAMRVEGVAERTLNDGVGLERQGGHVEVSASDACHVLLPPVHEVEGNLSEGEVPLCCGFRTPW